MNYYKRGGGVLVSRVNYYNMGGVLWVSHPALYKKCFSVLTGKSLNVIRL